MRRKTKKALKLSAEHAAIALHLLIEDGKVAAADVTRALKNREKLIRDLRARSDRSGEGRPARRAGASRGPAARPLRRAAAPGPPGDHRRAAGRPPGAGPIPRRDPAPLQGRPREDQGDSQAVRRGRRDQGRPAPGGLESRPQRQPAGVTIRADGVRRRGTPLRAVDLRRLPLAPLRSDSPRRPAEVPDLLRGCDVRSTPPRAPRPVRPRQAARTDPAGTLKFGPRRPSVTPKPETIETLFAYGRWANEKVLDSAAPLTAEELVRPIGGSFGSVQKTFVHLYGADWVWLERWHGRSPSSLPGGEELTTLDAIRKRWDEVQRGQRTFVEALTPARMSELRDLRQLRRPDLYVCARRYAGARRQPRHVSSRPDRDAAAAARAQARLDRLPAISGRAAPIEKGRGAAKPRAPEETPQKDSVPVRIRYARRSRCSGSSRRWSRPRAWTTASRRRSALESRSSAPDRARVSSNTSPAIGVRERGQRAAMIDRSLCALRLDFVQDPARARRPARRPDRAGRRGNAAAGARRSGRRESEVTRVVLAGHRVLQRSLPGSGRGRRIPPRPAARRSGRTFQWEMNPGYMKPPLAGAIAPDGSNARGDMPHAVEITPAPKAGRCNPLSESEQRQPMF